MGDASLSLLDLLRKNPRGYGLMPPVADPQFAGTGDLRAGPSRAEAAIEAINNSLPRRVLHDVVMAPVNTGKALGEAAYDPTPGNVGRAAVNVGSLGLMAMPGGRAVMPLAEKMTGEALKRAGIAVAGGGGLLAGTADQAKADTWGDVKDTVKGWFDDKFKPVNRDEFRAEYMKSRPMPRVESEGEYVGRAAQEYRASEAYRALVKDGAKTKAEKNVAEKETAARAGYKEYAGRMKDEIADWEKGFEDTYKNAQGDVNDRRAAHDALPFFDRNEWAKPIATGISIAAPAAIGFSHMKGQSETAKGIFKGLDKARREGNSLAEARSLMELDAFHRQAPGKAAGTAAAAALIPPAVRGSGEGLDLMFGRQSGDPNKPLAGDKAKQHLTTLEGLKEFGIGLIPGAAEGGEIAGGIGAGLLASSIRGHKVPTHRVEAELRNFNGMAVPKGSWFKGGSYRDMNPDDVAKQIAQRRGANAGLLPSPGQPPQPIPGGGPVPVGGPQGLGLLGPPQGAQPGPQPGPRQSGLQNQNYGPDQQKVARALVDSEVSAGRGVPRTADIDSAYAASGTRAPTSKQYSEAVNTTQTLVDDMIKAGLPPAQIVSVLKSMRDKKMPILGLLGASTLSSQSDDSRGLLP